MSDGRPQDSLGSAPINPQSVGTPQWVGQLKLRTLDPDPPGSVAMASIPVPADAPALVVFDGLASQALPIAWYPADQGSRPRQVLVLGLADGDASEELGLVAADPAAIVNPHAPAAAPQSEASWPGPTWRSTIVEEKKTGLLMREINELVLEYAGRRLGIRLGIEPVTGGFHWWEWLQIERLWTGPVCTAIRAGGDRKSVV